MVEKDNLIMKSKNGTQFVVEVDFSRQSHCSKCGQTIRRATTQKGKKMSITKKDGERISHFDDCKFAGIFRKTS